MATCGRGNRLSLLSVGVALSLVAGACIEEAELPGSDEDRQDVVATYFRCQVVCYDFALEQDAEPIEYLSCARNSYQAEIDGDGACTEAFGSSYKVNASCEMTGNECYLPYQPSMADGGVPSYADARAADQQHPNYTDARAAVQQYPSYTDARAADQQYPSFSDAGADLWW